MRHGREMSGVAILWMEMVRQQQQAGLGRRRGTVAETARTCSARLLQYIDRHFQSVSSGVSHNPASIISRGTSAAAACIRCELGASQR